MRSRLALAALALLLAGCASPPSADGPQDDGAAPDAPVEYQYHNATYRLSTHANCLVDFAETGDGLVSAMVAADERSKGQPFEAYINVTDGVQVMFTRVEFLYEGVSTNTAHGNDPGKPITGKVPAPAAPVRVNFDVCGTTPAEVRVTYKAQLAPA